MWGIGIAAAVRGCPPVRHSSTPKIVRHQKSSRSSRCAVVRDHKSEMHGTEEEQASLGLESQMFGFPQP